MSGHEKKSTLSRTSSATLDSLLELTQLTILPPFRRQNQNVLANTHPLQQLSPLDLRFTQLDIPSRFNPPYDILRLDSTVDRILDGRLFVGEAIQAICGASHMMTAFGACTAVGYGSSGELR